MTTANVHRIGVLKNQATEAPLLLFICKNAMRKQAPFIHQTSRTLNLDFLGLTALRKRF